MAKRGDILLPCGDGGLRPQLDELERWRQALDAKAPLVRSWEGQLRRDLQAEAVAASTSMEGVPVTVEEVRRILAGERPGSVAEADRDLVLGYRDAMSYALRRADDPVFEWSPELVKAIHDKVMAGRFARGAGRYGKARFIINDQTGEVVYEPPAEPHVERLVERVCRRVMALRAHPAVAGAWIHVAIAAVHPFADGNGRTARVLASLAMYRGGFKRPEFCSLEEWWGRHRSDYYAAFGALGRRWDPAADVTPFVRAHVSAQLSQVRALDLRERTTRQVWVALERVCEDAGIPSRAAMILWDLFNERSVTPPYYVALADISRATATADLATMRGAGLIAPVGATKGRHYVAGPRLYELIAKQVGTEPAEASRSSIVGGIASRLARVEEAAATYAPANASRRSRFAGS
jgi:Fic family protein